MARPEQLRAARALLGLSQPEVAAAAGLSSMTVKRAEGSAKPPASEDAMAALRAALEAAGVEFIAENGGGAGVRLKRLQSQVPVQGPVDAPMIRTGRRMKTGSRKREDGD